MIPHYLKSFSMLMVQLLYLDNFYFPATLIPNKNLLVLSLFLVLFVYKYLLGLSMFFFIRLNQNRCGQS